MAKIPAKARLALIESVLEAFNNDLRMLILGHLFEAGKEGLRSNEIAKRLGKTPDHVRKHLVILEQALLVQNQVGRDKAGVFSRYVITEYGEEWFEKLGLKEGNRALPLLA